MKERRAFLRYSAVAASALISLAMSTPAMAQAADPGVRLGTTTPAPGTPLPNLTADELTMFNAGAATFQTQQTLATGLGPRFNLDSCLGCHSQPAIGGAAPAVNPQVSVATAFGAQNQVPQFVNANGPIVEARFKVDPSGGLNGGVHSLFVITGRNDGSLPPGVTNTCNAVQENFNTQFQNGNVSLRQPISVFGDGLIEAISDQTILNNHAATAAARAALGIGGVANRNGNTGTITRFGWKAQNQSLLLFAGEADDVEIGRSNELFQNERDDNPTCQFAPVTNDFTLVDNSAGLAVSQTISDIQRLSFFIKFLNQLPQSQGPFTTQNGVTVSALSVNNGRTAFSSIGCQLCHTVAQLTSTITDYPATSGVKAVLWSDLLLHHMGPGLADGITQGLATGDMFKSATLWGLGQRLFFMHDGRAPDLLTAIEEHASAASGTIPASEANAVIAAFNGLPGTTCAATAAGTTLPAGSTTGACQQDILNFLRNL
jgi:CxxC motif-containing protein (DUF1111 family)